MTSMPSCFEEPGDSYPYYSNIVAVGIDLTLVADVRESLCQFGERYLRRLFTPLERADCWSWPDPAPHLAARFAAKEATIKALMVEDIQPVWTSMEVWRNPVGWWDEMRLTGAAARLASNRGMGRLSVTLSHDDNAAVAVVVAEKAR